MSVRQVAVKMLIYLAWLAGVFAVLFVARSRFYPNPHFPPPMLFLIASAVAGGITVAQALRKRR